VLEKARAAASEAPWGWGADPHRPPRFPPAAPPTLSHLLSHPFITTFNARPRLRPLSPGPHEAEAGPHDDHATLTRARRTPSFDLDVATPESFRAHVEFDLLHEFRTG
jgi:hypothetical protein